MQRGIRRGKLDTIQTSAGMDGYQKYEIVQDSTFNHSQALPVGHRLSVMALPLRCLVAAVEDWA